MHTGQLQQSLDSWRRDQACASWSGDESDGDTAALAGFFGREGVRFTEVGTPVAAADGQDGQFGDDDGGADGGRDFLGGLDAESDVAFRVADDDDSLESGALTSAGLFLDGFDLNTVILSVVAFGAMICLHGCMGNFEKSAVNGKPCLSNRSNVSSPS